jgi:hypothetical protein
VGALVGVLCNQAMLESLGVGSGESALGAVAIQWVLKDGFGMQTIPFSASSTNT